MSLKRFSVRAVFPKLGADSVYVFVTRSTDVVYSRIVPPGGEIDEFSAINWYMLALGPGGE